MTQPLMYHLIEGKRSVRMLYTEGLVGRGDITPEEARDALADYQKHLSVSSSRPARRPSHRTRATPRARGDADDNRGLNVRALSRPTPTLLPAYRRMKPVCPRHAWKHRPPL